MWGIQKGEGAWALRARMLSQKVLHVRNATIWNLLNIGEWNLWKNSLIQLTGSYFTYIQTHMLIPKLSFVTLLRITAKGEIGVVFKFCNYCFLSLSCSSFWSIIFVILDVFWALSLKKHKHFPSSLLFLIHNLPQTFLPVCISFWQVGPVGREISGTAVFSLQTCISHQVDAAAPHRSFSSELSEGPCESSFLVLEIGDLSVFSPLKCSGSTEKALTSKSVVTIRSSSE